MKEEILKLEEIKLIGISVRTKFQDELDPKTSNIMKLINYFYSNNIQSKIPNRINPGRVIVHYSEYEEAFVSKKDYFVGEYKGSYTYFIGEEVSDIKNLPEGMNSAIIKLGNYLKCTTPIGKMPDVLIKAWFDIWAKEDKNIPRRSYISDFEVYDQKSKDPNNAIIDIYLGIN